MTADEVANAIEARAEGTWDLLRGRVRSVGSFSAALALVAQRRRARARGVPAEQGLEALRVAIVGGSTLSPLRELVELFLWAEGFEAEVFAGDYDNYVAEILEPGTLDAFGPHVTVVIPSDKRARFEGPSHAPLVEQRRQVDGVVDGILALCAAAHERTNGDVVVTNFVLPAHWDIGGLRVRSLAADYTFKKAVNLELGLRAPSATIVCDLEFAAARSGGLAARDSRRWFESKQLFSPEFCVCAAREIALAIKSARRSPRKLLILDLDNTLWGGVIGDDGVEGIELGDTSPRGEAFKAFQTYIKSLKERGVLLAVCSKNDYERAIEPFQRHPEMVLKLDDFVSFKASWDPKSESIREMATELALGADSFVFVDDNPAEVEIVRQFVPEVATIALGPDPSTYVAALADSRHFEPRAITAEDQSRSEQYRREAQRQAFRATVTDMSSYLTSLEMAARVLPFRNEDVPRIAQLINKSNQFNLTTRRRSEAEVAELVASPAHACFTIRLSDRFGDHGLIAVVITELESGSVLAVDTWLMSCRVLKRQVEELTMNEIVRLAMAKRAETVRGRYLATPKNGMVRELYPRFGFHRIGETTSDAVFERAASDFRPFETKITTTYE